MTKKPRVPKDQLDAMTGHDRLWWLRFVQKRIAAHTSGPLVKGHAKSSLTWIDDVVNAIIKTLPKDGQYDGNMRVAYLTSFILGTWFSRVLHSKTFDPRRPTKIRRGAYAQWRGGIGALVTALYDEQHDPLVFNGKPHYENPFDPKAKSGRFV